MNHEPHWTTALASHDTVLGQLQRGLGSGFLAALAFPREDAHALLDECLRHDTRHDLQTNERADYLAELVLRTRFDVGRIVELLYERRDEPEWFSRLARQVLSSLARQSDSTSIAALRASALDGDFDAHDIEALFAGGGLAACEGLDAVLCARLDDERLRDELDSCAMPSAVLAAWGAKSPRIARALSARREENDAHKVTNKAARAERPTADTSDEPTFEELLMALGYRKVCDPRILAKRARREHVELLVHLLQPGRRDRLVAVVYSLRKLGYEGAERALLGVAQRLAEFRPYERGLLRLALGELPPALTLPLARAWVRRRTFPYDGAAASLLAKHAEERDLELVVGEVLHDLRADGHGNLSDWFRALRRFPGRRWQPGVEESYLEMSCSLCRSEAVETLVQLDRERFARTYALECLWDCESSTIEAAIPHVPLEFARSRLVELADACAPRGWDVRAAARKRLT